MISKRILMLGASGFLGSHLARQLSREGHFLKVATRRRDRARQLLTLPTCDVVEADVHDPAELAKLCAGQDVVMSLVGILQGGRGQPYGPGFATAHVELPRKIAVAAQAAGIRRVVHVSALQAAADAPSGYLRSKAAGEAVLREANLDLTVFRPSVIFGTGDQFLNVFSDLLGVAPFLPLACPEARFQPVWVEDVTACISASLQQPESIGQTYDLCGPHQYSLRELVDYVGMVTGQRRPILGLSDALSYLQAWIMEFVPGAPLSRDSYASMQVPSVCSASCVLPFGRRATPLEAIAPLYLKDSHRRARNDILRKKARR